MKTQSKNFDVRLADPTRYYFREDAVEGVVEISTPKQLKVARLELIWSGRVRVQNPDGVKDEYELFSETSDLALINENGDWRADAFRRTATVPSHGFLLPPAKARAPPKILEPNQVYSYPFRFNVPDHCVLPSCTETETGLGGVIEYSLEGFLYRPASDSPLITRTCVPVLQRIDVTRSDYTVPQQARAFISPFTNTSFPSDDTPSPNSIKSIVQIVLPRRGYVRSKHFWKGRHHARTSPI
ncbi:hypothetical protein BCR43DRAFT_78778 [Syncephalastrum racemosum]|uniref:Arrestin-like N-terminal domain-containing protein n=1 Tax=Syncephalastrum racemosum TaxID=13706 RepID=A0A1X2H2L2_SYNRA|nr:hypothetical protein BCR43DRAFT_78778 [Syncephalastrum racemosum]